ncbi:MAG: phosphoribosyl-AMP cyclohydrolase [Armatimonadetes bacterium]|nr:phosphoribosyl-AMP cyclohydrolase [Armatimonadota bacterium]
MECLGCLRFDPQGLIFIAVQDADTLEILTLAYMNREALEKTLETGKIHVYRRSKDRVMMKGETSGMTQDVTEVRVNCDNNSIVFKVRPHGPGCHEGYHSCYFRRLDSNTGEWVVTSERGFDPKEVYRGQ